MDQPYPLAGGRARGATHSWRGTLSGRVAMYATLSTLTTTTSGREAARARAELHLAAAADPHCALGAQLALVHAASCAPGFAARMLAGLRRAVRV